MSIEKSVVVIPTLKRPELLALTLEKISQTPEGEHLDVRIFADTCTDERLREIEYCRDTYLPTAEIFRAGEHIKVLSGCYNILMSLKAGWETGKRFLFLIEEDIFIRPEFFQRHWSMHESDNYFVTCGRKLGNMPLDFYSNPGTCYTHESFAHVIPHINNEFFSNCETYLNKHFPTMVGMDGNLDDGLIRKVQRSINGKVLCADPPVAYHQGFHYFNRLTDYLIKDGPIQDRIAQCREVLSKTDPNGRYTRDFEPYR